jgi:hypothetical protein
VGCRGWNDVSRVIPWTGAGEARNDKDKVDSGDKVEVCWTVTFRGAMASVLDRPMITFISKKKWKEVCTSDTQKGGEQ